jgi:hypothetical protein
VPIGSWVQLRDEKLVRYFGVGANPHSLSLDNSPHTLPILKQGPVTTTPSLAAKVKPIYQRSAHFCCLGRSVLVCFHLGITGSPACFKSIPGRLNRSLCHCGATCPQRRKENLHPNLLTVFSILLGRTHTDILVCFGTLDSSSIVDKNGRG